MLVVACALSLRAGVSSTSRKDEISTGVRSGMMAFSVLFGLVVGAFGGLGYTATEVFLDSCAEWMPLALDAEAEEREAERTKESKATATTPKEAEAKGAAALSSSPSSSSSTLPAPPEPSCSAAELAAATALRHKFIASRYKNIFASHIYASPERRLAGQAGRMTAGFSDCSPSEAAMWRREESSSILLPASSSLRRRTGRSSQMQQEGQQPRKI